MLTYKEDQKQFYSTRSEVLKKFREEQEKKCYCYIDEWAGNENQIICLNCIRKVNLKSELDKQYKVLKISPVYPATVTMYPSGHLYPEGSLCFFYFNNCY